MNMFDGRKFRNDILENLKVRVANLAKKPVLSVIWVGDDFASGRYIESKKKASEKIGIHFDLVKYPSDVSKDEIAHKIIELNNDPRVDGIMIQIPLPKHLDVAGLILAIDPAKDVDGLRYCAGEPSNFFPPVIVSILQAIKQSGVNYKKSKIAIIGKGFLVGSPLARMLRSENSDIRIADKDTPYLKTVTLDADIIISATGVAGLIKSDMIKDGVVLIDAGTTEVGGEVRGDIDMNCYRKASFYTPVPGGIGPVTVAMLLSNLVKAAEASQAA